MLPVKSTFKTASPRAVIHIFSRGERMGEIELFKLSQNELLNIQRG